MSVKQLIKELQKFDENKIVILTDPDGKGWDNIGEVIEEETTIKITADGNGLFQE